MTLNPIIEFEWYDYGRLCSYITIHRDTGEVEVEDFTDCVLEQFLGKRPHTIEQVYEVWEERCFDRNRVDKHELLKSLGLTQYDPYEICLQTNGRMLHDNFEIKWIKKGI